jgi:hypothetical protein
MEASIQFNGKPILYRTGDGYINATQLCMAGGKEFCEWKRRQTAEDFLKDLSIELKMPIIKVKDIISYPGLIEINHGGNANADRSTWVHPRVAINISTWISDKCLHIILNHVYKKQIELPSTVCVLHTIEYPQVDDEQTKQLLDDTKDINNPFTVEYVVGCVLGRESDAFNIYMKFGHKKFNKSWIYVSTSMKLKYFTNERGVNVLKDLNKRMFKDVKDTDCNHLTKPQIKEHISMVAKLQPWKIINLPSLEDIKDDGNRSLYTIMTGEFLKRRLIESNTEDGRKLQTYLLKIEEGFTLFAEYTSAILYARDKEHIRQNEENKKQLQIANQKILEVEEDVTRKASEELNRLTKRIVEINERIVNIAQEKGWFYIVRVNDPAFNFIYKLGKTTNMQNRMTDYANAYKHARDGVDCIKKWEVTDLHTIERIIMIILDDIRVWKHKEFFYVYNENEFVEYIDSLIKMINPQLTHDRVKQVRERYQKESHLILPVVEDTSLRTRSVTPKRSSTPRRSR